MVICLPALVFSLQTLAASSEASSGTKTNDNHCSGPCIRRLLRHVGITQAKNPWFVSNAGLWTRVIWEEKLGNAYIAFLRAIGTDPKYLLEANKSFCQGYDDFNRCAHEACDEGSNGVHLDGAKAAPKLKLEANKESRPLLVKIFGQLCADSWRHALGKFGRCTLEALGSSGGKLCIASSKSTTSKLNAYTFTELIESSWSFYALNGRTILDAICSLVPFLSLKILRMRLHNRSEMSNNVRYLAAISLGKMSPKIDSQKCCRNDIEREERQSPDSLPSGESCECEGQCDAIGYNHD